MTQQDGSGEDERTCQSVGGVHHNPSYEYVDNGTWRCSMCVIRTLSASLTEVQEALKEAERARDHYRVRMGEEVEAGLRECQRLRDERNAAEAERDSLRTQVERYEGALKRIVNREGESVGWSNKGSLLHAEAIASAALSTPTTQEDR